MGKLITIAGNIGSGKTTLARLLCDQGGFIPYWEKPEERPFQRVFSEDMRKWSLPNQVDFLLFRCEQEQRVRMDNQISVMDGGLDQDFHVFTKNLYHKGHLGAGEFGICERFYRFARSFLPPPDMIIRIVIDTPTLLQRRSTRTRQTVDRSFNPQELADLERLLDDWLKGDVCSPILPFPFEYDLNRDGVEISELIHKIRMTLANTASG